MFRTYFIAILFIFLSCKSNLKGDSQQQIFPENKNGTIVNDYSNILSEEEKSALFKKLYAYEIATTNQIVVVTIDSIAPYTDIQKYATGLGKYWGVGQKDKDNGLILVFSKPLSKVSIATGVGAEKILTDSICKQVLETTMIPNFKKDNYFEGISIGLDSLILKWENRSIPSD